MSTGEYIFYYKRIVFLRENCILFINLVVPVGFTSAGVNIEMELIRSLWFFLTGLLRQRVLGKKQHDRSCQDHQ